jgi:hypothetical protein
MLCMEDLKIVISDWLRSGWVWDKMVNRLRLGSWNLLSNIHMYAQHLNLNPYNRLAVLFVGIERRFGFVCRKSKPCFCEKGYVFG